jgi:hypothetical protein
MRNITLKCWSGLILIALLTVFGCKGGKNPAGNNFPNFNFESSQSGCREGLGRLAKASGSGSIVLSSFDDTIRVLHANAYYNCCAQIKTKVVKTEYGFDLFEKDEGHDCRCMCYTDITTFIYDISAGTYSIRLFDVSGNLIGQGNVIVRPKKPNGNPG